jgi:uncharacterized protein DUF4157
MHRSKLLKAPAEKDHVKTRGLGSRLAGQAKSTDPYSNLQALQRSAGNQALSRWLRPSAAAQHTLADGLSRVRVHAGPETDSRLRAQGAAAYVSGHNVYLGSGLDPNTDLGRSVLAHEFTHVVQQMRGEAALPLASQTDLEAEAGAVSGVGSKAGPIKAGAAIPGSVQKITEAELLAEWRKLHPKGGFALIPGAPGELPMVDEAAETADREAFKEWREERLHQLGAETAAKVRPWTEVNEERKRATAEEERQAPELTDAEGRPIRGPVMMLPSEVYLPVIHPSTRTPQPKKRDLAAEARAAWEARTPLRERAQISKRPPPRMFIGEHERALLEASTMFDLLPGAKLGRNIIEFIEGEDILGRKLDRREVSREISKEILLQVVPLLIPEGGLIGEGGAEARLLERELGEAAPVLERELGEAAPLLERELGEAAPLLESEAGESLSEAFRPTMTPAAEHPEGFLGRRVELSEAAAELPLESNLTPPAQHPEGFLERGTTLKGGQSPATEFSSDPRDLLSMQEQMQSVQFDPEINPRAGWRSAQRFTPEPGETKSFGPRTYTYDADRNLVRASTTDLTLGVRDKAMYAGVPGMGPGEDYGHLLGIDFGNIDAQVGRYGGFRQAAAVNRPLGVQQALWYDAERTALDQALQLKRANQSFEVVTNARGYVNGVPSETRIYVSSSSGVMYDSGWIANPVTP